MHEALNRNLFFVKEHVGMFKAANNFDVHDPETQEIILECREPHLGFITKLLRFTDYKRMTPFDIEIKTPDGELVCSITRGISIFLSRVTVKDGKGEVLGGFKQKFFSIGGKFDILDRNDQPVCTLKGKWTSWEFRFEHDGNLRAHVAKKWSGLGKEMFTSADNYMLQIEDDVPPDTAMRALIMASVMCIDMVLKE